MDKIQDTNKPAPWILNRETTVKWISSDLKIEVIQALMNSISMDKRGFHFISTLVTSRAENSNRKEVLEHERYDNLPELVC